MHKNKTRLTVIAGTTMALVMAGTAAVSAHPGDRDGRGGDRMKDRIEMGAKGGRAMPGMQRLGGMRGAFEDFERRETTLQTADGVSVRRVEQGAIDAVSDASLTFALASGESVTVAIDDDTSIVAFEEQTVERGRRSRERMVPTEVAAADIEAGVEIVVWSDSEEGAEFVASRIVIQPAEDFDEATETETETVEEASTEEAATLADA